MSLIFNEELRASIAACIAGGIVAGAFHNDRKPKEVARLAVVLADALFEELERTAPVPEEEEATDGR